MTWLSTYASTATGYQSAKHLTIGRRNTSANSAPPPRQIEAYTASGAYGSAKTEPASTAPHSAIVGPVNAPRDFRAVNRDKLTYRCLKSFMGWFNQRDCTYSVKNPDHDRCWFQRVNGECNRED